MKQIILIICMLLSISSFSNISYSQDRPSANNTENGYVTDLDLALRLSKETKQNVVLIFSAEWCGHCRNLKIDLPSIKEFDDKIICIIDSDKNKKLARQFKAKSLPTSVMLNINGEEISRTIGYDKESYRKWLSKTK